MGLTAGLLALTGVLTVLVVVLTVAASLERWMDRTGTTDESIEVHPKPGQGRVGASAMHPSIRPVESGPAREPKAA